MSFITGENKPNYAKSLAVTHTAFLKRGDFLKIIRLFPDDYVIILQKFRVYLLYFHRKNFAISRIMFVSIKIMLFLTSFAFPASRVTILRNIVH